MKTTDSGGMYKTNVRYWTHGLIIAAVCWSLFSGFMVFDIVDMHRPFGWDLLPHFFVWGIHLTIIGLAVYCYRIETPRTIIAIEHRSKADWHVGSIPLLFIVNLLAYLCWRGHWAIPIAISIVSVALCVMIVRRLIAMKRAAEKENI